MTLKIRKIRYTSHHGFSIDFERPGEVALTPEQAYVLYLGLQSELTQEELDQHFSEEEQHIIIQYHELMLEKIRFPSAEKRKQVTAKGIRHALVKHIDQWLLEAPQEIRTLVEQFLGWRFPKTYVSYQDKFFSDFDIDDLGVD